MHVAKNVSADNARLGNLFFSPLEAAFGLPLAKRPLVQLQLLFGIPVVISNFNYCHDRFRASNFVLPMITTSSVFLSLVLGSTYSSSLFRT
mmetsp:Transcript_19068/g.34513  ORF Transcript_19068/g.34513 Transcript_19068/m.34513 type:complete len:91 (+) Transcript_19068:127-399(+)